MRRRPSTLAIGAAAAALGLLIGAGGGQLMTQSTDATPVALVARPATPAPQAAVTPQPTADLSATPDLERMARKATAEAQLKGADISFTLLDRQSGIQVSSGDDAAFPIASVAKLFIADDLFMQAAQNRVKLKPEDRRAVEVMLQSSDDFAADDFWTRDGGNSIIDRVAARYGLKKTTAPYDGNWWNTMSTTADLVQYYDKLLDGTGGLPPLASGVIVADLAASTPVGVDGYPQRFGIPDGLFAESVAVKQGWMCCWGAGNWVHMSTGVVGADRRYIIAIGSMQPADDKTARDTLTDTIKAIFPDGRI